MTTRDWGLFRLHHGDCRRVLTTLAENSVDAIVTDPPYELGFMGKGWDKSGVAFDPNTWGAALRVLKPGGHMIAFGGTRTYHRLVCAIEDGGFEVRDQIGWAFGSGMPKSPNIDGGFGLALKPAWEPVVLARKPLIGTVAATREAHGTGVLNIDGCRVPCEGGSPSAAMRESAARRGWDNRGGAIMNDATSPERYQTARAGEELGRWPANLIHDGSEEVLDAFPDAPGQLADASSSSSSRKTQNVYGAMKRGNGRDGEASADSENRGVVGFKMKPGARRSDDGSAARFFYCAKASKTDRGEGNTHPTVKPTDLMRYLCRLVTPAGGLVLDPFNGSGSTGKAAVLEGFRYVGIDLTDEYLAISERRIGRALWGEALFP